MTVFAPRSRSQRSVGKGGDDARLIADRAVLHRNVEVLAQQHAFAAHVARVA